ncbi:MAG: transcription antitermination factor NusB [Pseudomonadota bacterium]
MSQNRRTLAREYAFKFLYHLQLPELKRPKDVLRNKGNPTELQKLLADFDVAYREEDPDHPDNVSDPRIRKMALPLIEGTIEHNDEIEKTVILFLNNWKLKNIDKVAQTILYLATFELLFMKDTPVKVVINEAINLAKKFGQMDSFAFVNGILDNIAKSNRGKLT